MFSIKIASNSQNISNNNKLEVIFEAKERCLALMNRIEIFVIKFYYNC